MKYKITISYNWYQTEFEKSVVKTYMINGVPFTFDELIESEKNNPDVIEEANNNQLYTPEIFYNTSFYLIDEECHPCLFPIDLENPELLENIDSPF